MIDLKAPNLVDLRMKTHSNLIRQSLLQTQTQARSTNNLLIKKPDLVIQKHPLLSLLSKPHGKLSDGKNIYNLIKDYTFFYDLFTKNHQIKYDLDSIFNLCTKLQVERYLKGAAILKEGEFSNNKMYLISIGTVFISKRHKDLNFGHENELKKSRSQRSFYNSQDEDFNQYVINQFGEIINELDVGNYFGERALLEDQRTAIRSASCIAATDCYLITLQREDFLEVLKQFKKDSQAKKELFLQVIPYFDQIVSHVIVENIIYSFKETIFNRDEMIFQEGQSADYLYIIQEGEIALLKQSMDSTFQLCLINSNELVGEDSLFHDYYLYSVIAVSQEVRMLKIGASSFQLRAPSYCIKSIHKLFDNKLKQREKQLKNIIQQNNKSSIGKQHDSSSIHCKLLKDAFQQNEIINLQKITQKNQEVQKELKSLIEESYPFDINFNEFRSKVSREMKFRLKLTNYSQNKKIIPLDNLKESLSLSDREGKFQRIPSTIRSVKSLNSVKMLQPKKNLSIQPNENILKTSKQRPTIYNLKKTIIQQKKKHNRKDIQFAIDESLITSTRFKTVEI